MATVKELQARLNFDEARKSVKKLTQETEQLKSNLKFIRKELDQLTKQKNKLSKKVKGGN